MTAPELRRAITKGGTYRLSDSSLALLALLHERGGITMTDAAAILRLSTAALTGLADRLEHLGLATRVYQRADRRKISMEVTPRGVLALEDILTAAETPALTPSAAVPV